MSALPCANCGALVLSRLSACRQCGFDAVRHAQEVTMPLPMPEAEAPPVASSDDAKFVKLVKMQPLLMEVMAINLASWFVPTSALNPLLGLVVGWLPLLLAFGVAGTTQAIAGGWRQVGLAYMLLGLMTYTMPILVGPMLPFIALAAIGIALHQAIGAAKKVGYRVGFFGVQLPVSHTGVPAPWRKAVSWTVVALAFAAIPACIQWRRVLMREADAVETVQIGTATLKKPKEWTVEQKDDKWLIRKEYSESGVVIEELGAAQANKFIAEDLTAVEAGFACEKPEETDKDAIHWYRRVCTTESSGRPTRDIFYLARKSDGTATLFAAINKSTQPISDLQPAEAMIRSAQFGKPTPNVAER